MHKKKLNLQIDLIDEIGLVNNSLKNTQSKN